MNKNYSHHIRGRVRARIPALKANAPTAQELQIAMQQLPGVKSVEVNLLTGSVLVHYNGESATAELVRGQLQSRGAWIASTAIAAFPRRKAQSLSGLLIQADNQTVIGQIGEMVVKAAANYLLEVAIKRVVMATLICLL